MSKQVFAPYVLVIGLGLSMIALSAFAWFCKWNPNAPPTACAGLAVAGLCLIIVAANRIMYLRAALVIAQSTPVEKAVAAGIDRHGVPAVEIDGCGTYSLDRWHNVYDDSSREILVSAKSAEVFIDPSDGLPALVRLQGKTFLLSGKTEIALFKANKDAGKDESDLKPAYVRMLPQSAVGYRGWIPLVSLIFCFCGAFCWEYEKVGNHAGAIWCLLYIPATLLYFLPFIVGSFLGRKGGDISFAVNLLLGWTGIGWIFVWWRVLKK